MTDTLQGMRVVTSTYLTETVAKVIPYSLPRCRVRTRSIQKGFNRARRRQSGVRTVYALVPSQAVYQVGRQLLMHPALLEKLKSQLAKDKS